MKAKQIFEFKKTGDPKKSLKLGYKDLYDYVKHVCKNQNIDPESFWGFYYENMENNNPNELTELYLDTLIKFAPLEDQIAIIDKDLNDYFEFIDEME